MDPSGLLDQLTLGKAILLVVCLLLSAAFSAAETALSALSESKVKAIVEAGGRRARLLKLWLDKPQHVLTATLIGDQAVNTTIAVIASLMAQRSFESPAITIGVAVVVMTLLVFGEITPRSFAKTHAAALAPSLMPLVWLAYIVSFPLVIAFTRFSQFLVRLSGGNVTRTGPFVTEEDIVSMIQLGSKEGVLDKQEGRMLASIFDLGETLVREVMRPRTEISALPVTATLDEVLAEVRDKGHSRLPVYDSGLDDVKGFFHTKDLFAMLADQAKEANFQLREHLRPVLFVPELMRTSDLLKLFQRKKIHLAVVVDEYGGTSGIVAFEDVLEEIVGPIQDEHDEDEAPFRKLDDGRYVAEGRAGLYEIGEAIGVTFPTDQGFETVGGFLIARCGRMPQAGDRVVYSGYAFVVRDADEKRVARVDIEKTLTAAERASRPPELITSGEGKPESSGPHKKAKSA